MIKSPVTSVTTILIIGLSITVHHALKIEVD